MVSADSGTQLSRKQQGGSATATATSWRPWHTLPSDTPDGGASHVIAVTEFRTADPQGQNSSGAGWGRAVPAAGLGGVVWGRWRWRHTVNVLTFLSAPGGVCCGLSVQGRGLFPQRHCGQGDEGRGHVGSKRAPAGSEQVTFPLDVTTGVISGAGGVPLQVPALLPLPRVSGETPPRAEAAPGSGPEGLPALAGGRAWGFRVALPRMFGPSRVFCLPAPALVLAALA